MNHRWIVAWALGAFLVLGCTSAITLRHPDGRTARCGPYYYSAMHSPAAAIREGSCVADFQRQGFQRMAE